MRTQDDQSKSLLAARSLLACSSSSILLSTDERLWLKFLYLLFDRQRKQIDQYLQNNTEELVRICTNNQRLQQVIHQFNHILYCLFLIQNQISAIGLLCSIKPNLFLKSFLTIAYQRLETDRYLSVNRRSYEIMKTPSGQLYDKAVMET